MAETNLDIPTLEEVFTRVRDDLESQLPGEGAKIRRTFLYVTAAVISGATWGLYKLAETVSRNIIIDRADDEEVVERHASIYGITRDYGTQATGTFRFTGTPATNIPAGSAFERDNGTEYTTDAIGTIGGGGDVDIAATATEPGTAANITDLTETLTLSTPISGVSSDVTPVSVSSGTDVESVESLRTRVIERIRSTPQGGAGSDYVAWVKEAPGVSADVARVFVSEATLGPGTVVVWFLLEGSGSAVIPTAGDIIVVNSYLNETDTDGYSVRRPVTADLTVLGPVARATDFSISISPNNATVQGVIEEELERMFSEHTRPNTTNAADTIIRNAYIHEALTRALSRGLAYYELTSVAGGAGTDDIEESVVSYVPLLGTVTYATA